MEPILDKWTFREVMLERGSGKIVCYRLLHNSGLCAAYLHPQAYRNISRIFLSLHIDEPFSPQATNNIYVTGPHQDTLVTMLGTRTIFLSSNIEPSQLEESHIYDEYNFPVESFPIKDITDLHDFCCYFIRSNLVFNTGI